MVSTNDDILDVSKFSFSGNFEEQVLEVLERVRLSKHEVETINTLLDDLHKIFSKNWPGSQVKPFGSIVSGLGIKSSDLDCYVSPPEEPYDRPVKHARTLLSRKGRGHYTEMLSINTAKVPVLKFVHKPTGTKCDVSFTSEHGVRNSKLIAALLFMDNRAINIAVLIKYWSKVYNLAGMNLMPNYGVTMMVIFYLQVKKVLPSVESIQRGVEPCMVGLWDTAYHVDISQHKCENHESLYQLLGGFFDYYRSFNYEEDVIAPFVGHIVKKEAFKNIDGLPSYRLYAENLSKESCEEIKLDTAICIQDPFEHSRNCAAAVYPKLFKRFQDCIELSAKAFHEVSEELCLKELFSLSLPSEQKKPKQKYKKKPARRQHTPPVSRTQFKPVNGRQVLHQRSTRAKQMFLQYKKEQAQAAK